MSQSLCKCNRSLSQESVRNARYSEYLVFLFATDHRHILCSSWSRRISEKSRKEICIAAPIEIRVSKNLFPDSRSVKLKERDTVNNTANLSTLRHLTNQSMIPESGIMERRHQKHVSLRCPFPLPRPPLGSLRSPIFFLSDPVFCLFPPLRSQWSHATIMSRGKAYFMNFLFLLLKGDVHFVKSCNSPVVLVQGIYRTNHNHLYGNQYIQYSA